MQACSYHKHVSRRDGPQRGLALSERRQPPPDAFGAGRHARCNAAVFGCAACACDPPNGWRVGVQKLALAPPAALACHLVGRADPHAGGRGAGVRSDPVPWPAPRHALPQCHPLLLPAQMPQRCQLQSTTGQLCNLLSAPEAKVPSRGQSLARELVRRLSKPAGPPVSRDVCVSATFLFW